MQRDAALALHPPLLLPLHLISRPWSRLYAVCRGIAGDGSQTRSEALRGCFWEGHKCRC